MKTFPEELREAAKMMTPGNAAEARRIAGLLELIWQQPPTDDLLREINGYWARGRRLMTEPGPLPEDKKSA